MQFTKANLILVRDAVKLSIAELHNQIATCPDVYEYAEDIEAIEAEKAKNEKLLAMIEKAVEKEASKCV